MLYQSSNWVRFVGPLNLSFKNKKITIYMHHTCYTYFLTDGF